RIGRIVPPDPSPWQRVRSTYQAFGPPPTNVRQVPKLPVATSGSVAEAPLLRISTNEVVVVPAGRVTPVGSATPPVVSALAVAGRVQASDDIVWLAAAVMVTWRRLAAIFVMVIRTAGTPAASVGTVVGVGPVLVGGAPSVSSPLPNRLSLPAGPRSRA